MAGRKILSRRHALGLACCGMAALTIAGAQARSRAKLTKAQAEYQDSPKDIRMCATCSFFVQPKSCRIVEGDVSPTGWCKAFALAD